MVAFGHGSSEDHGARPDDHSKRIRERAGLLEGDVVAFEIEGDHLIVRKVARGRDEYLQGLSATVSEWASPEDEDAWRDL